MTTTEEKKILSALSEVQRLFKLIDKQHPDEGRDFIDAVHIIQGLIMQRIARRADPTTFATFRNVRGVWERVKIEG